jgi:RNA polymerase sigma-70 factor (ECF subfamily)
VPITSAGRCGAAGWWAWPPCPTGPLVDDLPEDRRSAFVLTQVIGCSYEEAAAVCGVPIGTIRSRVARAREQLTTALRESETG